MKKNALYRLRKLSLIVCTVMLAASCRSIPQKAELQSSMQMLPDGSDVVIRADIDANRELIEPVLAGFADLPPKLTENFLERTETVWAGLELTSEGQESESGNAFSSSIVAVGDYPKAVIETGLWWNPDWKKQSYNPLPEQRTKFPYWYEKEGRSQLAFPDGDHMFASGGNIEEMIDLWAGEPAEAAPLLWLEAEQSADVTIMTRNLSSEEYAAFVPELKRVPIESLVLSMKRQDDNYLISGRFQMDSELSSFLFATLFRTLIVAAKDPDGNKRFDNPRDITVKKDGKDVVLSGMTLPVVDAVEVEKLWLVQAGLQQPSGLQ